MAKKAQWQPAENFVRNGVAGNYTKALTVSTFHYNALNAKRADPKIKVLWLSYTPFHNTLVNASATKGGAVGDRIADTATKDELFVQLNKTEMPEIQQLISGVYRRGTAKWRAIFPFGLKQIQNGTIENKLIALKVIHDKVHADVALATADAILDPFYTLILGARTDQTGEKTVVGISINDQQAAIEAMCVAQFGDYGMITFLNPNSPNTIKSYIDWETLQTKVHSSLYEGTVNAKKTKMALTRKFTADSKLMINSSVDMMVWVNDSVHNPNHPVGIEVTAGNPTIVSFPDLGNPDNRVLQVQNLNLITKGNYLIEVL